MSHIKITTFEKKRTLIEIGKYNELTIVRSTSVGLYLSDSSGEEVLLPNKYCPEKFSIGDKADVFVYLDHEERKVATNITPKIFLNEFALLRVSAVTEVGAFMDWGMEKELLVPFSEQNVRMEQGRSYIVYMDIDRKTGRLFASNKTEKHLQNDVLTVAEGDHVPVIIYQKTDLGYSVIVNHKHKGLVYDNEIFTRVKVGDKLNGVVKKIREDNKMDISLNRLGYDNSIEVNCDIILFKLRQNNGFLPLTDKSDPAEVYRTTGMSKKAFKKTVGALYKQKQIDIKPSGIALL